MDIKSFLNCQVASIHYREAAEAAEGMGDTGSGIAPIPPVKTGGYSNGRFENLRYRISPVAETFRFPVIYEEV